MQSKYKKVLNLTKDQIENMTFKKSWEYGDFIQSQNFESGKNVYNCSNEELLWMNLTQKYALVLRFTNETRKIYLTKLLKEPLDLI